LSKIGGKKGKKKKGKERNYRSRNGKKTTSKDGQYEKQERDEN
jgi:hypothetical protein